MGAIDRHTTAFRLLAGMEGWGREGKRGGGMEEGREGGREGGKGTETKSMHVYTMHS